MEKLNPADVTRAYTASARRILFLEYEGTLVENADALLEGMFETVLAALHEDSRNNTVILSDLSMTDLNSRLNRIPVTLVAESGGFIRNPYGQWQNVGGFYLLWKEPVVTALRRVADSYPGTTVEEKHFSVKWTFNNGLNHISEKDRRQLFVALRMLSTQYDVPMIETPGDVEYRTAGITKGKFVASWLNLNGPCDFILAIGNDKSDEDMFDSIGRTYLTVRVGHSTGSKARYYVDSRAEVLSLLRSLAVINNKTEYV